MLDAPSATSALSAMADAAASGDADRALAVATEALAQHPDSLPVMEGYISALDRLGRSDEALSLAIDAARRRIVLMSAQRPPSRERQLAQDSRVFLSGYFYSGSGAVLDYLKDFDGTAKWSPAGEMRLIKFPGGIGDLARRHKRTGALTSQDVLDLYLHIIGGKPTTTPAGSYGQWKVVNKNSGKLLVHPRATDYVIRCLECFGWLADAVATGAMTRRQLVAGFRNSVGTILDAAATGMEADCLLVDQAITAWRLALAKFVPPSTFIVVHRDPRDQFVDASVALSKPGRTLLSAEDYAVQYRNRRLVGEKAMSMIQDRLGHRVIRLSFEEFVVDHDTTTQRLIADLGFEGRARSAPRYDVQASRANIGKHRDLISVADAATIAAALPEYLSPHAG
jgi:hypothetical protein